MVAKKQKTRKTSSKVLKVDSPSKIPQLEKILKQGKVTVVLVFADWCGHCHKFQENIWEPMCKKNSIHNRVSVRDDMIKNTSLANTNFKYLPSVLVVNEKGEAETFTTPDGEQTNAMPTPKNMNEMERVVNVPLTPAPENGMNKETISTGTPNSQELPKMSLTPSPVSMEPLTDSTASLDLPPPSSSYGMYGTTLGNTKAPIFTPQGKAYTPIQEQKGGAFYDTMKQISHGLFPVAILGGLAHAMKGGKRKSRKTHRKRRMIRA
jgi:thiol-disulfide isomerase/thioredoxin